MFVPEQYKMTDPADVLSLMQANPFAAFISHDSDGLTATHLPTVASIVDPTCRRNPPNITRRHFINRYPLSQPSLEPTEARLLGDEIDGRSVGHDVLPGAPGFDWGKSRPTLPAVRQHTNVVAARVMV